MDQNNYDKKGEQYTLPPVEGVIPPNDQRYLERLRIAKRLSNSEHPLSTTRDSKVSTTPLSRPAQGLSNKYSFKSVYNMHDIVLSPVEKSLKMLEQICSGEREFSM
ncbi:MAG TPA: hypothetical protein VJH92_04995 [Candidatus Nanoarchaeia archaeon]|nr:hypothetical protein [Candidatus Nanoarchaeia archaeon]